MHGVGVLRGPAAHAYPAKIDSSNPLGNQFSRVAFSSILASPGHIVLVVYLIVFSKGSELVMFCFRQIYKKS